MKRYNENVSTTVLRRFHVINLVRDYIDAANELIAGCLCILCYNIFLYLRE